MSIPFEEMQALAEKHELSHIVLFALGEPNVSHIVTWGRTTEESDQAAIWGHALQDELGWPEAVRKTSAKVQKLINWILRCHLQATITEGTAADLLAVHRVELRKMMIDRYGEDWRDAAGDDEIAKRKLIAAGDLDELIQALKEDGIGVNPDGTTFQIEGE